MKIWGQKTKHEIFTALGAAALIAQAVPARAQDDVPAELQCIRYLQSYERNMRIPQGLLTAISLVETGRPAASNGQLTAWPWSINVNGQGKFFDTKEEAVAETRKMMDEGQRSIDVGCLQVNLRYHPTAFRDLNEAFDPASNVAYGAQFLVSLHQTQGSWEKAVERYHSSDDGRREEYRDKVISAWNNDAKNLVMNAVLAENTDTPYHRAVRDFVTGKYTDALDKYEAIVDLNPKDRIGLLGLAMSYEKLGRTVEAKQSYARYLALEPENQSVLAGLLRSAHSSAPTEERADLQGLLNAGVESPELYSALAEVSSKLGDYQAAFKYAQKATDAAPSITAYHLNAGILADRLSQRAVAVKYYEEFLAMFDQGTVVVDTNVNNVRDRVRFLRSRL